MKFPVAKNLVSNLPSAQPPEVVGRARANARTFANAALNRVATNRASAAQHCKQAAIGSGNNVLQHVKSQNPVSWSKVGVSRQMFAQQGPSPTPATHRLPETLEWAMLETLHFDDGNNQMTPQTTLPADANTRAQKPPMKPIFAERNFVSALPVSQEIGVIDMPKPQRAVFKNTQPAPDLAASKLKINTVKIDADTELARGKMPVSGTEKTDKT